MSRLPLLSLLALLAACKGQPTVVSPETDADTDADSDADTDTDADADADADADTDTDTDTDTDADTDTAPPLDTSLPVDTGACVDDGSEDNDTLATAVPLPSPSVGLISADLDPDYFVVTVPPLSDAEIVVSFGAQDIDVALFDMNGQLLESSESTSPSETVTYRNWSNAPVEVVLNVYMFDIGGCQAYDVAVTSAALPTCPVDGAEANDSVATAYAPVTAMTSLGASPADDDYFVFTVPAGAYFDAVLNEVSVGSLQVTLYDESGTALAVDSVGDGYEVGGVNPTASDVDWVLEVLADDCVEYDLDFTTMAGANCAIPDSYESNDSVATAVVALPGTPYQDLRVNATDRDYFRVSLAAGEAIRATAAFDPVFGEVDLSIFDEGGNTTLAGPGVGVAAYVNDTAGPRDVLVAASANGCMAYDLDFEVFSGPDCVAGDTYEDNDDPLSSVDLLTEFSPLVGLSASAGDSDFYSVELADNQAVTFDLAVTTNDLYGAPTLELTDGAGLVVDTGTVSSGTVNQTGAAATYTLEVGADACMGYDLAFEVVDGPDCVSDDAYDPGNDTFAGAVSLDTLSAPIAGLNATSTGTADVDNYLITVPTGYALVAEAVPNNLGVFGTPEIRIYDGDPAGTGVLLAEDVSDAADPYDVFAANTSGAPAEYLIEVQAAGCLSYDLDWSLVQGPSCATQDAFEPNDTYTAGTDLLAQSSPLTGLNNQVGSVDLFTVSVPAEHTLGVAGVPDLPYFGEPAVQIFVADPAAGVAVPNTTFGASGAAGANTTTAAVDWTVEVSSSACIDYELAYQLVPCDLDDALEPNDDVLAPTVLPGGSGTDLRVSADSIDAWSVGTVQPGETLSVDATFLQGLGDIDLLLMDEFGVILAFGWTSTDNESLSWTNTGTYPSVPVIQVSLYGPGTCMNNVYDLTTSID